MKNSAKIISVLLLGGSSSVFGQVVASDLARSTDWGKLSEAFTNDISALFSDSASAFSAFTIGWDGSDPTTSIIITDPVGANPTGQAVELAFTILAVNPDLVTSNYPIPVSYVGNESIDDNWFGYWDLATGTAGDGSNDLYNYFGTNNSGAPDDPTAVYSKPSNPDLLTEATPAIDSEGWEEHTVTFWHRDDGFGSFPGNELAFMGDEARFYIFEATETVVRDGYFNDDTYYLMAVDDRETLLVDFDDGLFLTRITDIGEMAVPEPSAIGLAAFALLLGLGVSRRNRKA
jgi:hypothetical protein